MLEKQKRKMYAPTSRGEKPHAVLVPFPAQGHVNPLMQLAKLLRGRGFHITFVNTELSHHRLVRAKGPGSVLGLPDFVFETIPDGLTTPGGRDTNQLDVPSLCESMNRNCLEPFRQLLHRLNESPGIPTVSCVVSDAVMSFAMKAAEEVGVPEAQFWTASACGLMGYCQYAELVRRGIIPLKDESAFTNGYLETPLEWIPGTKGLMRLRDVPAFCHTTNPDDIMVHFMIEQMNNCTRSSAVIINTLRELEQDVICGLENIFPKIYAIGPLNLMGKEMPAEDRVELDSTMWKEDTDSLGWLDSKKQGSVVYINFGSVVVMTEEQMTEFAWGIEAGGYEFLWVLRPNIVQGHSGGTWLPEGFLEKVKRAGRGLITSWCPQVKVLSHPSVGLFVTHAGWNSLMESVSGGVPFLCWPIFAEQPTNTRMACTQWGIGEEIPHEVSRGEFARLVKETIATEKGGRKEKAAEWKKKAKEAAALGGSSYTDLDALINDVLNNRA